MEGKKANMVNYLTKEIKKALTPNVYILLTKARYNNESKCMLGKILMVSMNAKIQEDDKTQQNSQVCDKS